jgi:hypothetical protein
LRLPFSCHLFCLVSPLVGGRRYGDSMRPVSKRSSALRQPRGNSMLSRVVKQVAIAATIGALVAAVNVPANAAMQSDGNPVM